MMKAEQIAAEATETQDGYAKWFSTGNPFVETGEDDSSKVQDFLYKPTSRFMAIVYDKEPIPETPESKFCDLKQEEPANDISAPEPTAPVMQPPVLQPPIPAPTRGFMDENGY